MRYLGKLFALIAFASLLTGGVLGQESIRPSLSSTMSEHARHEIVQSNLPTGQLTFRLDKFTGRVFQLGGCPQRTYIGNGLCWKEMTVLELPKPVGDNVARYQIFMQGGTNRYIVLINTATGQSWQHGKDGQEFWTPFLEQIVLPQSYEIVK